MDCVACMKHLTLDYELGCGFFLCGNFKQVYKILGLFLLLRFGFKFLSSEWFVGFFLRVLCDLRRKPGRLNYGFCSKSVINGKFRILKFSKVDSCEPLIDEMEEREKMNSHNGSDGKLITWSDEECSTDNNDDDERECTEEDDASTLRKLLKTERHKVNAARAELERERAASSGAAEESMAMILRLQNEKSLIEMESTQFRRMAEEKQIHDQEVIRSLQWLVRQHESERSLLEDQLKLWRPKLNKDESEGCEEDKSSVNGNILDALDNVLYSSRDANNLSPEYKFSIIKESVALEASHMAAIQTD